MAKAAHVLAAKKHRPPSMQGSDDHRCQMLALRGLGLGFRTCYTEDARLVWHPAQQSKGAGVLLGAGVQGCIS